MSDWQVTLLQCYSPSCFMPANCRSTESVFLSVGDDVFMLWHFWERGQNNHVKAIKILRENSHIYISNASVPSVHTCVYPALYITHGFIPRGKYSNLLVSPQSSTVYWLLLNLPASEGWKAHSLPVVFGNSDTTVSTLVILEIGRITHAKSLMHCEHVGLSYKGNRVWQWYTPAAT